MVSLWELGVGYQVIYRLLLPSYHLLTVTESCTVCHPGWSPLSKDFRIESGEEMKLAKTANLTQELIKIFKFTYDSLD